jgi:putative ABC transport system permease protein
MFTFLLETLRLSLRNLRLHKLRTLLTALGIICGVFAVIVMVAIGEGAKQSALKQMEQLGATNVVAKSDRPPESTEASSRAQRLLRYGLKRVDLARLKDMPGLTAVVPVRDTEQKVSLGDTRAPGANALGTTPDIFKVINLQLGRGDFFTWEQYDQGQSVCVLGAAVARQLFPYQEPIGTQIKIGTSGMSTLMVTVIGVLDPTGLRTGPGGGPAIIDRDLDQGVYFPLTLAQMAFATSTSSARPAAWSASRSSCRRSGCRRKRCPTSSAPRLWPRTSCSSSAARASSTTR